MTLNRKTGIDFIGFPRGRLGVGEQLRSLLRMAKLNEYEINIIDCYQEGDRFLNDDMEFAEFISSEFKHDIRVYSATHNHVAALLWRKGFQFFDGAFNVFHFAWEFSSIEEDLRPIINLSDTVWGISRFTSLAFENLYGIPVDVMSNAVEINTVDIYTRDYFNLPRNKFLFCTSFDVNSFITRKNPKLVIESFCDGFATNNDVGLVIKVANSDKNNKHWKDFLTNDMREGNIYLIDEDMSREEVHSLFNVCNSYVSLHRSEGFGYGIAENMLMGKPVVCTGFSGNMDFCTKKNSFLVDFDLIAVQKDEYHHADGLFWANPIKQSAVEAMQQVYLDRDNSSKIGIIAKEDITRDFSTEALAKNMKSKIESIICKAAK